MAQERIATLNRKTAETDITLKLVIDGQGSSKVDTGVPFFDHMLTLFTKHGLFDLTLKANTSGSQLSLRWIQTLPVPRSRAGVMFNWLPITLPTPGSRSATSLTTV